MHLTFVESNVLWIHYLTRQYSYLTFSCVFSGSRDVLVECSFIFIIPLYSDGRNEFIFFFFLIFLMFANSQRFLSLFFFCFLFFFSFLHYQRLSTQKKKTILPLFSFISFFLSVLFIFYFFLSFSCFLEVYKRTLTGCFPPEDTLMSLVGL